MESARNGLNNAHAEWRKGCKGCTQGGGDGSYGQQSGLQEVAASRQKGARGVVPTATKKRAPHFLQTLVNFGQRMAFVARTCVQPGGARAHVCVWVCVAGACSGCDGVLPNPWASSSSEFMSAQEAPSTSAVCGPIKLVIAAGNSPNTLVWPCERGCQPTIAADVATELPDVPPTAMHRNRARCDLCVTQSVSRFDNHFPCFGNRTFTVRRGGANTLVAKGSFSRCVQSSGEQWVGRCCVGSLALVAVGVVRHFE